MLTIMLHEVDHWLRKSKGIAPRIEWLSNCVSESIERMRLEEVRAK